MPKMDRKQRKNKKREDKKKKKIIQDINANNNEVVSEQKKWGKFYIALFCFVAFLGATFILLNAG